MIPRETICMKCQNLFSGEYKKHINLLSAKFVQRVVKVNKMSNQIMKLISSDKTLTHCLLNRLSHTMYWKSPISILGLSGYEIYIFLEKNG